MTSAGNTLSTQPLDGSGNPQVDGSGNPVLQQRTEIYAYDDLSRLSAVGYGETQSYGFDPMGNRLSKSDSLTVSGATTTSSTASTYDTANCLISTSLNGASASAVTSDPDGNTLTDSSGRVNTWDSQNRRYRSGIISVWQQPPYSGSAHETEKIVR